MEHIQLQQNLDGTVCLDFYSADPFAEQYLEQMVQICAQLEQQLKRKIRAFPFRLGTCPYCGHSIITNRDHIDVFSCQNCEQEIDIPTVHTKDGDRLIRRFEEMRGVKVEKVAVEQIPMLVIFPEKRNEEILLALLDHYQFEPIRKRGGLYRFLLCAAVYQGWIKDKDTRFFLFSTRTTAEDRIYEDIVPRVEECDRLVRKVFENVYTLSTTLTEADVSCTPEKVAFEETIQRLAEAGEWEEAYRFSHTPY